MFKAIRNCLKSIWKQKDKEELMLSELEASFIQDIPPPPPPPRQTMNDNVSIESKQNSNETMSIEVEIVEDDPSNNYPYFNIFVQGEPTFTSTNIRLTCAHFPQFFELPEGEEENDCQPIISDLKAIYMYKLPYINIGYFDVKQYFDEFDDECGEAEKKFFQNADNSRTGVLVDYFEQLKNETFPQNYEEVSDIVKREEIKGRCIYRRVINYIRLNNILNKTMHDFLHNPLKWEDAIFVQNYRFMRREISLCKFFYDQDYSREFHSMIGTHARMLIANHSLLQLRYYKTLDNIKLEGVQTLEDAVAIAIYLESSVRRFDCELKNSFDKFKRNICKCLTTEFDKLVITDLEDTDDWTVLKIHKQFTKSGLAKTVLVYSHQCCLPAFITFADYLVDAFIIPIINNYASYEATETDDFHIAKVSKLPTEPTGARIMAMLDNFKLFIEYITEAFTVTIYADAPIYNYTGGLQNYIGEQVMSIFFDALEKIDMHKLGFVKIDEFIRRIKEIYEHLRNVKFVSEKDSDDEDTVTHYRYKKVLKTLTYKYLENGQDFMNRWQKASVRLILMGTVDTATYGDDTRCITMLKSALELQKFLKKFEKFPEIEGDDVLPEKINTLIRNALCRYIYSFDAIVPHFKNDMKKVILIVCSFQYLLFGYQKSKHPAYTPQILALLSNAEVQRYNDFLNIVFTEMQMYLYGTNISQLDIRKKLYLNKDRFVKAMVKHKKYFVKLRDLFYKYSNGFPDYVLSECGKVFTRVLDYLIDECLFKCTHITYSDARVILKEFHQLLDYITDTFYDKDVEKCKTYVFSYSRFQLTLSLFGKPITSVEVACDVCLRANYAIEDIIKTIYLCNQDPVEMQGIMNRLENIERSKQL